jgi:hypothetical protein
MLTRPHFSSTAPRAILKNTREIVQRKGARNNIVTQAGLPLHRDIMFKKIILPSMHVEIDGKVPNAAAFGTAWSNHWL